MIDNIIVSFISGLAGGLVSVIVGAWYMKRKAKKRMGGVVSDLSGLTQDVMNDEK